MEEDYTACYRVLGLYHRASWTEIRQAYGRAMRRWHPDRHTQNVAARREAEEKTKQIVSAYRRLALYYRQQGCPPPYEPHAASSLRAAPTRPGEGFAAHDVNPSAATTESAATPRRGYRLVRLSFTLGLLTVIGVFVFGRPPHQIPTGSAPLPATTELDAVTIAPHPSAGQERFFTVGSTPQEVYAAQGVPDRMDKDVWYYGQARVYFVDGKVDRWETTPDSPLRVNLSIDRLASPQAGFFTLGATREEVRAVQGNPTRTGRTHWEYGASKVYFDEQGRVTGWEAAEGSALRARH